MKNPPNSSEQALEDYFHDLLFNEPASDASLQAAPIHNVSINVATKGGDTVPFKATVVDAFSGRPVLAAAPRALPRTSIEIPTSPAAIPLRAYAEPIKTLNLRMPLPALAPAPVAVPVVAAAVVAVPELVVPTPTGPQPELLVKRDVEKPAEQKPAELPAADTQILEASADQSLIAGPAAWLDNGRPAWAQRPFECLLFKVGGLALAAPLAELGSIYLLDTEAVTSIFGQAAWFMGLLPVKGYNVRAIDAAQVVMPERYSDSMRADYRYVITLHGSDWGLAVDSVANSVVLQPDDVRWRGQRSKRPWLAGTVVTQMCALLDVAQLIWMFQNQDGKRMVPQT